MDKIWKVALYDKQFQREVEIVKTGELCDCIKELDDKRKYKLRGENYETIDGNFTVGISKYENNKNSI